jgi:serine/threonine-protein kinase
MTQPGEVLGTPKYIAPEARLGLVHATWASDLYSFGVLAHELLGGRHPEAGVSLARYRPDLDAALVSFVDRCLGENPADRPRAHEFASVAMARSRLFSPSGIGRKPSPEGAVPNPTSESLRRTSRQ